MSNSALQTGISGVCLFAQLLGGFCSSNSGSPACMACSLPTEPSPQPHCLGFFQFCFPSKHLIFLIPSPQGIQVSQEEINESLLKEQSSVCTGNYKIHFLKTSFSHLTFKTVAKRQSTKFTEFSIFKFSLWN